MLRACAMTLVVVVEEERGRAGHRRNHRALMHEHPSRAIVLRVRQGDEPCLDSSSVRPMLDALREPQQICCEQVEMVSSLDSFSDASSVLRGLGGA